MIGKALGLVGDSQYIAAATTAPTPVQVKSNGQSYISAYLLVNTGGVTVFFASGATAALATANAVIPIADTGGFSIPVLPGAGIEVSADQGAYWTAITASGTADCYVSPLA